MLRFSRHARNRLRWWRVAEGDVVAAIDTPDRVLPSVAGRTNAWKQFGDRWLRVTYTTDEVDIIVVTMTLRRRGPEAEGDEDHV